MVGVLESNRIESNRLIEHTRIKPLTNRTYTNQATYQKIAYAIPPNMTCTETFYVLLVSFFGAESTVAVVQSYSQGGQRIHPLEDIPWQRSELISP